MDSLPTACTRMKFALRTVKTGHFVETIRTVFAVVQCPGARRRHLLANVRVSASISSQAYSTSSERFSASRSKLPAGSQADRFRLNAGAKILADVKGLLRTLFNFGHCFLHHCSYVFELPSCQCLPPIDDVEGVVLFVAQGVRSCLEVLSRPEMGADVTESVLEFDRFPIAGPGIFHGGIRKTCVDVIQTLVTERLDLLPD